MKTSTNHTDPEYHKLYKALRKQIINGTFNAGDILPSESELQKAYKLSQPTVRHATELLVKERLIEKKQGKGSIVLPRPPGIGIISINGEVFTSQADDHRISTEIIQPPEIRSETEIDMGYPIEESLFSNGFIYLSRRRLVDAKPIFFEEICFPNINFPRFTRRNLSNKSFYHVLEVHYDLRVRNCHHRMKACAASEASAKKLDLPVSTPILHLQRKFETNQAGVIIYSNLYANTENYYLYGFSN